MVARKLAQNVTNLGHAHSGHRAGDGGGWSWPAGGSVAPGARRRGGAAGAVVMAVVAFLANDSVVIPAFVALVLAPLLVAAGPGGASRHPSDAGKLRLTRKFSAVVELRVVSVTLGSLSRSVEV